MGRGHALLLGTPTRRLLSHHQAAFVPAHGDASDRDIAALQDFVSSSSKLLVLTGAGASTESGIPDYRLSELS